MITKVLAIIAIFSLNQFALAAEETFSQNLKSYTLLGESTCVTDSGKVFPDPNIKMLDGSLKLTPNSESDKALLYSMNLKFEVLDKKMTCVLSLAGLLLPGNISEVFRAFVYKKENVKVDECNQAIGINAANLTLVINDYTNQLIMAKGIDDNGSTRACGSIHFLLEESIK